MDGRCVEMPNEPPEYDFKHKVRLWSYPTLEQGGVVWTYMGPKELQLPPPNFNGLWFRRPIAGSPKSYKETIGA